MASSWWQGPPSEEDPTGPGEMDAEVVWALDAADDPGLVLPAERHEPARTGVDRFGIFGRSAAIFLKSPL